MPVVVGGRGVMTGGFCVGVAVVLRAKRVDLLLSLVELGVFPSDDVACVHALLVELGPFGERPSKANLNGGRVRPGECDDFAHRDHESCGRNGAFGNGPEKGWLLTAAG